MSNGDKVIKDLEVCPNCGRYLFPRINFDVVARHYLIWLECLTCRFLTDNVYIGKVNFTIAYPGDRQNVEAPAVHLSELPVQRMESLNQGAEMDEKRDEVNETDNEGEFKLQG